MSDATYRKERIERLLHELRYEVERGMMEGEIEETLLFAFIVPIGKSLAGGVVRCEFRTRPTHFALFGPQSKPGLQVIDGGKS
ncbi:hypothetical protein [Lysobacter sp. ESA13C]|uniref:hypothetical protein n=1 Tax=Lysobacter sp. ESA13C TaxID=2862676 RepID=UPI001CC06BC4|nr:hypothetical protein [Lysobacter sp. ESA13C]